MLSEQIKDFIEKHKEDSIHELLLSKQSLQGADLKLAVQQIEGRQRIQHKLPSWYKNKNVLYPIHLSLEQCSSELTARYKAQLVEGESLIDLTGGFGVDTTVLSERFKDVIYVEQNPELVAIAQNNFKAFGLSHIHVQSELAEVALQRIHSVDWIFIDPARRGKSGGKLVSIGDCEPNIIEMQEIFMQKAQRVLVKMSPMLDIKQALRELHHVVEVHVIAVQNECKELLLVVDYQQQETLDPMIYAVNIKSTVESEMFSFHLSQEEEYLAFYSSTVKEFIYEPNVSLLKAGAFNTLSKVLNIEKLHVNSHLYTSERLIEEFPGRKFKVERVYGFDKNSIREFKKTIKQGNVTVRNFPSTVASIRKKLKITDGGEHYIFATTLCSEDRVLIVCSKI